MYIEYVKEPAIHAVFDPEIGKHNNQEAFSPGEVVWEHANSELIARSLKAKKKQFALVRQNKRGVHYAGVFDATKKGASVETTGNSTLHPITQHKYPWNSSYMLLVASDLPYVIINQEGRFSPGRKKTGDHEHLELFEFHDETIDSVSFRLLTKALIDLMEAAMRDEIIRTIIEIDGGDFNNAMSVANYQDIQKKYQRYKAQGTPFKIVESFSLSEEAKILLLYERMPRTLFNEFHQVNNLRNGISHLWADIPELLKKVRLANTVMLYFLPKGMLARMHNLYITAEHPIPNLPF